MSWQPGVLDRWLEEDEEVIVHPRDPHKRVEALASSRHVQVSLEGTVLADSHSPVLLFETDLPTRFYLPREDVRLDLLVPTSNRSECPYKGFAEEYWSVPGVADGDNVAWSYAAPFPAVATDHGPDRVLQRAGRHRRRRRAAGAAEVDLQQAGTARPTDPVE